VLKEDVVEISWCYVRRYSTDWNTLNSTCVLYQHHESSWNTPAWDERIHINARNEAPKVLRQSSLLQCPIQLKLNIFVFLLVDLASKTESTSPNSLIYIDWILQGWSRLVISSFLKEVLNKLLVSALTTMKFFLTVTELHAKFLLSRAELAHKNT